MRKLTSLPNMLRPTIFKVLELQNVRALQLYIVFGHHNEVWVICCCWTWPAPIFMSWFFTISSISKPTWIVKTQK